MPIVATVVIDLLDMAVLPLTLAPSQHHSPVGQEHGRTIPLADGTPLAHRQAGLAVSYWKVIMSVRLSVVAFGFKGSFAKFALPEFKTL
jgi:hypothetical protein